MKTLNKILFGTIILSLCFSLVNAQDYEVAVTSGQKIVIENLLGKIIIKDSPGTKLKIECTGFGEVSEKASGLKEIYSLVELWNMARLEDTKAALNVALSVARVVLNSIDKVELSDDGSENTDGMDSAGEESGDGNSGGDGSDDNTLSDEQFEDLLNDVEQRINAAQHPRRL